MFVALGRKRRSVLWNRSACPNHAHDSGEKIDAIEAAPWSVCPKQSHRGHQGEDLIANGIGNIEMEIVKLDPAGHQAVGKNTERVQIQGIEDQNRYVQQSERAESRIAPFMRFKCERRS